MSALDVPLAGDAAAAGQEFQAGRRSRNLTRLVLVYAFVVSIRLGWRFLLQNQMQASVLMMLVVLALVAYAVRSARLKVHASGVRWGWATIGFHMEPERIREVRAFDDAVMVVPARGMPWFLVARDWTPFERMVKAFAGMGVPFSRRAGKAPLGAKLQGYGLALDLLVIADAVVLTLLLLA
jgi:hypothetical protein